MNNEYLYSVSRRTEKKKFFCKELGGVLIIPILIKKLNLYNLKEDINYFLEKKFVSLLEHKIKLEEFNDYVEKIRKELLKCGYSREYVGVYFVGRDSYSCSNIINHHKRILLNDLQNVKFLVYFYTKNHIKVMTQLAINLYYIHIKPKELIKLVYKSIINNAKNSSFLIKNYLTFYISMYLLNNE